MHTQSSYVYTKHEDFVYACTLCLETNNLDINLFKNIYICFMYICLLNNIYIYIFNPKNHFH